MRNAAKYWKTAAALVAMGLFGHEGAYAFESENGVPLTIFLENRHAAIESIAIRLQGRDVAIATALHNDTAQTQALAFYAYTPIFNQLGEGEEYLDKRFADLRVLVRGKPGRVEKLSRSYFLGKDITAQLVDAGIDPAPSLDTPAAKLARLPKVQGNRPEDWEGAIVYAWTDAIGPGARSTHEIRYRDLPQFGLEDIASERFAQRVQQHCGNPAAIVGHIRKNDPNAGQVLVERHEFPLPYMAMREVSLETKQPERNWLGGRPLVSLVCGIKNPDMRPDLKGVLPAADQTVQVLTISLPGSASR